MHLWLTLTVFLFNTSCRLLNFGKSLSNNWTNIFAALVVPFVLNRGLITVISLCLFSVFYWRMFGRVFLTRFIVIFYWVKNALILRIQSECWKMWTRITPNTDTIYAVFLRVASYSYLVDLNAVPLEMLHNFSLMWNRSFLMIWAGWFDEICTYVSFLFASCKGYRFEKLL